MKRCLVFGRACAFSIFSCIAAAAGAGEPGSARSAAGPVMSITLEEAWRHAAEANPALHAARAGRLAAEGQVAESRALLWNNPEVSYESNRHRVPQTGAADQRFREWTVGVSQAFEVAGQGRHRGNAARSELEALDASLATLEVELYAEVEDSFVKVLALQRRVSIEAENLKLVEGAAQALKKRVDAGESSRLDGNLAAVEAERMRNQLAAVDEQLVAARADLARLLQLPAETLPEAVGALDARRSYDLDQLISRALRQPRLDALGKRESAARSRVDLEKASVYPDVTLGVSSGRDGPGDERDRIVGLTVSVPLPLFKRNQAGIARATSELAQTQIERRATERDIRAAVHAQWMRHERMRARVERLRATMVPPLEENFRLSRIAYDAGELGLTELLLVNRQILDVRREALEAETELRLAQIALERVTGMAAGKNQ